MRSSERTMVAALSFAALDSTYLTWRYLALRLGLVTPGTSICSWTARIDCDRVLLTPQANAFFVPNALLGAAFYLGCLLWWIRGTRLGPEYRYHVTRTLTFWLCIASLLTLRFFWLLVHLPFFCPVCPLNHFATYIALASAIIHLRQTPAPSARLDPRRLVPLIASCVLLFVALHALWYAAIAGGLLRASP